MGDFLWSLPTVRAIAEKDGEPVDLLVAPGLARLEDLVSAQPYVKSFRVCKEWEVRDEAPVWPWNPGLASYPGYPVVHLGYREWPREALAFESHRLAVGQLEEIGGLSTLDLYRPWITIPPALLQVEVLAGFSDEWFELKYGIYELLTGFAKGTVCGSGSRWDRERQLRWPTDYRANWTDTAKIIAGCKVFLGCLSSMSVLAAALGKPRVLVEPNQQRHHPIFQHWDTPVVIGLDGKPTADARHVADAIREKLGQVAK